MIDGLNLIGWLNADEIEISDGTEENDFSDLAINFNPTHDKKGKFGRGSLTPEQRKAKVARYKELRAEIGKYFEIEERTGGLSDLEAAQYEKISKEQSDIYFELYRPTTKDKVLSPKESKSTLNADTVVAAMNDKMKNKAAFDAIEKSRAGVYFSKDTPVDDIMNGKNNKISAETFYNTFSDTREALRKQYGETVPLYRAVGSQKEKYTTNWATTEEFVSKFGDNIIQKDTPVDNVIAANVFNRGGYHELIVGKPPVDGQNNSNVAINFNPTHDKGTGQFGSGGNFNGAVSAIIAGYDLPKERKGEIYQSVKSAMGKNNDKAAIVKDYSDGAITLYRGTNGKNPQSESSWKEFDSPNGYKFTETNSGLFLTADKSYAESYGKLHEFGLKSDTKILNKNDDFGAKYTQIVNKALAPYADDFESHVKVADLLARDQGLVALLGGYDAYVTAGITAKDAHEIVIVNRNKLEVLKSSSNGLVINFNPTHDKAGKFGSGTTSVRTSTTDTSTVDMRTMLVSNDAKSFSDKDGINNYVATYSEGKPPTEQYEAENAWVDREGCIGIQSEARKDGIHLGYERLTAGLDVAVNTHSLKDTINLYRGMATTKLQIDTMVKQGSFKTKTFFATGLDAARVEAAFSTYTEGYDSVLKDFRKPTFFRIKAPKGTKGMFMDARYPSASYGNGLGEFVPSRDTTYKVKTVLYIGNENDYRGAVVDMEITK